MKKKRLLAVDDNAVLISSLKEKSINSSNLEIVLEAYDGESALDLIRTKQNEFDVILLDLIMPNKDGMYVLNKMKEENINKDVIITTSFNSDEMLKNLTNKNIKYVLMKPFDYDYLENIVMECTSKEVESMKLISNNDLKISLTRLLHELGVPSNIKGYQYVREGILLLYQNPSIIGAITKQLYPSIADKYDTSVSRVERAIRHAIEVSWARGNMDLMDEVFGHSVDYDKAKPTNSEFLVTLADKLKLEYQTI